MCPCISSKSKYALCLRHQDGLMIPSVSERENYCFDLYELCPLFSQAAKGLADRIGSELMVA
jgi:hypothetical protein